jgi:hypothetical protein
MKNSNNWSKGKRGFQSTLDANQQVALMKVFIFNDWKRKPAREFLESTYGIEIAERTLTGYRSRLKTRWDEISRDVDIPVDWSDFVTLEKNGVPSRHLKSLHGLWLEIQKACLSEGQTAIPPSYRDIKWWAFILEYYGDILESPFDRQLIAEEYAAREMLSEVLEKKFEREDLDMWLIYRPWESEGNMNQYEARIKEGQFSGPNFSQGGKMLSEWTNISAEAEHRLFLHIMMGSWLEFSPRPYDLPSEVLTNHMEEFQENYRKKRNSGE